MVPAIFEIYAHRALYVFWFVLLMQIASYKFYVKHDPLAVGDIIQREHQALTIYFHMHKSD